jgi:hypothetical protein
MFLNSLETFLLPEILECETYWKNTFKILNVFGILFPQDFTTISKLNNIVKITILFSFYPTTLSRIARQG